MRGESGKQGEEQTDMALEGGSKVESAAAFAGWQGGSSSMFSLSFSSQSSIILRGLFAGKSANISKC